MTRARMLAAVVAVGLAARSGQAQNYRFSIPKADVVVSIGRDGSAVIDYALTFTCAPGAHAIDVVDIGMPNMGKHEPVSASINGQPLSRGSIAISTYLKPRGSGYEVPLGGRAIRPGQTGVFRFRAREHKMVWQDTTNPDLASFRFTPTWFGSAYVTGNTELTLRYRLPIPTAEYARVKDFILWQKKGEDFSLKGIMEGEDVASVAWKRTVRLTGPNAFGVSFPKRFVSAVRKDSVWRVLYRWFAGSPEVRFWAGALLVVAFGVIFLTATRLTGWSLFIVLTVLGVVFMSKSPGFQLLLFPVLAVLGGLTYANRQGRKKRYFPADVCREGGGVKRGLTAVEAAVLLELPLNKVLTMVIFGLAKKGLIRITGKDPLKVEVLGKEAGKTAWRIPPDDTRVDARPYETAFLRVFREEADKPVDGMDLSKPFDALLARTTRAVKGFALEPTRLYYRSIVARAWKQVRAEADYESRFERVDRNLDWLLLDEDWRRGLDGVGGERHAYRPWWWYGGHRGTVVGSGPRMAGRGGGKSAPRVPVPDTSFGDVASSLTGRLEGVSTKAVAALDGFKTTAGGGIDLSGVDHFTADMLKSMASGSGGGGGGGCACACAGCACACACAGGGR